MRSMVISISMKTLKTKKVEYWLLLLNLSKVLQYMRITVSIQKTKRIDDYIPTFVA